MAILPRLTLAGGDARVAVRELPGRNPARDLYAVARASSVRRPAVALIIEALTAAAHSLPGTAAPAGRDGVISLGLALSSRQVREQVLVPDQHLVRSDVRGTRGRSKGGQHEAFVGKARESWRAAENDEVR